MLGLPKKTEMNKQLPKKVIYEKFKMNTAAKEKFDGDIKKLTIINEISPLTVNVEKGKEISNLFVLRVSMKSKDFDEKNILLISKLINQNLIFVLEYENHACLAAYHQKFHQSHWQPIQTLEIKLNGLNLDTIWVNLLIEIGGIEIEPGNTLDEQLVIDEVRQKLEKQITTLEKQARIEKQPKNKFELVQKIKILQKELEDLNRGYIKAPQD